MALNTTAGLEASLVGQFGRPADSSPVGSANHLENRSLNGDSLVVPSILGHVDRVVTV
jgi:hypothetical protein